MTLEGIKVIYKHSKLPKANAFWHSKRLFFNIYCLFPHFRKFSSSKID